MRSSKEDLRCSVLECCDILRVKLFWRPESLSHSKIDELHAPILRDHDISRSQISVHEELSGVQVVQALQDLPHQVFHMLILEHDGCAHLGLCGMCPYKGGV